MATKTITAANSVFLLTIPGLYSTPQLLQGYAADAAFDTAEVTPTEGVMGVDGILSFGFVPFPTDQSISLMPNSPSSQIFEDWLEAMKTQREVITANASISLTSVGRKYTCTNGTISRATQIPGVAKVLKARTWSIMWNNVSPANF